MSRRILVVAVLLLLVGCQQRWGRSELYFGFRMPDGAVVSDEAWRAFVDEEITPRFPDGLTVVEAYGQWRDATGQLQREPSRVLMVLTPPGAARPDAAMDAIAGAWCRRFSQEAVMRVDEPVVVKIVGPGYHSPPTTPRSDPTQP